MRRYPPRGGPCPRRSRARSAHSRPGRTRAHPRRSRGPPLSRLRGRSPRGPRRPRPRARRAHGVASARCCPARTGSTEGAQQGLCQTRLAVSNPAPAVAVGDGARHRGTLSSTERSTLTPRPGATGERDPAVLRPRLVGERDPEDLVLVGLVRMAGGGMYSSSGVARLAIARWALWAKPRCGITSRPNVSPSAQTRRASVMPPSRFTSGWRTSTAPASTRCAEAVAGRLVLARRDRRRDRGADAREPGDVVRDHRLLDPAQADARILDRPDAPDRVADVPAHVGVGHHVDVGADGVDHRADELDVPPDPRLAPRAARTGAAASRP